MPRARRTAPARVTAPSSDVAASAEAVVVDSQRLLSIGEVAAMLAVDPMTVRRWSKRYGLPHVLLPSGQRRFDPRELLEWIKRTFTRNGGRR